MIFLLILLSSGWFMTMASNSCKLMYHLEYVTEWNIVFKSTSCNDNATWVCKTSKIYDSCFKVISHDNERREYELSNCSSTEQLNCSIQGNTSGLPNASFIYNSHKLIGQLAQSTATLLATWSLTKPEPTNSAHKTHSISPSFAISLITTTDYSHQMLASSQHGLASSSFVRQSTQLDDCITEKYRLHFIYMSIIVCLLCTLLIILIGLMCLMYYKKSRQPQETICLSSADTQIIHNVNPSYEEINTPVETHSTLMDSPMNYCEPIITQLKRASQPASYEEINTPVESLSTPHQYATLKIPDSIPHQYSTLEMPQSSPHQYSTLEKVHQHSILEISHQCSTLKASHQYSTLEIPQSTPHQYSTLEITNTPPYKKTEDESIVQKEQTPSCSFNNPTNEKHNKATDDDSKQNLSQNNFHPEINQNDERQDNE